MSRFLYMIPMITMLVTTACGGAGDSGALTARVDDVFAEWDKPGSPGVALAVVQDGQTLYQRGYGSANLEYDIPIIPSTVFDIASVSKQFAGMAIAMLVEQGKISLEDDIHQYLPEMPDFGKTITIRHCRIGRLSDW
jgi:CubicO group peptidase (beta-lactamase class C family)